MDILSGSRMYGDWVKKANWLGLESLGICEHNTLAGAMKFQLACKGKIKSIIGMSITVKNNGEQFRLKLFVKDSIGWLNLLRINKVINIDNEGHIDYTQLKDLLGGLQVIIDTKFTRISHLKGINTENWYYSLEPVEFVSTNADNDFFLGLNEFIKSDMQPVASLCSHYLERGHAFVSEVFNNMANRTTTRFPTKQWFMSEEEYISELQPFFKDIVDADSYALKAINNANKISNTCDFNIPEMSPDNRHLPHYKMKPEEIKKYGNINTMMEALIEDGLKKKVDKSLWKQYRERIALELEVLDIGNVRSYFLILWDIINWSRSQGIIVGIGRGSAAGSLVAYLMDITRVNPIEYNLLFERFLNPGRVEKSLPDIDVDFSGKRRNEVKQYIIDRYGKDYFCDVGTYTNMKAKSLFKELGKLEYGYEHYILNEMTKYWPQDVEEVKDLLKYSCGDPRLKQFVKSNSELIGDMHLMIMQPKAESIHACATIIVPDDRPIWEWIPVKLMIRDGEKILVSQWEGPELEATGFLKEDILGVAQLDKYEMILNRIKEDTGETVDLDKIPLDDKDVMKLFQEGANSDIFHFGSAGLTQFCRELKPENINDLIAANSLYRPGPIEQGFHKKYIKRKNGLEEVTHPPHCEHITKDSYGVICYQEQIMLICQHIGGLTLAEADSIRKSMVKKDLKSIGKFVDQFKENGMKVWKIPKDEIDELWDTLLSFAKYAFNRSHAAAYSITAYYGQWLKLHYPLQFWATAFSFARDEDYPVYLAEIYDNGTINMHPPHINISEGSVVADKDTGDMYWPLSSIKGCGDIAYAQVLRIRDEVGGFTSFENFLKNNLWKADKKKGIEGSKVNKTVIEAFIASGAFDILEDLESPSERLRLLQYYREKYKVKVDKNKDVFNTDNVEEDWWWSLKQKELSGVAKFDFHKIAAKNFELPYIDEPIDIELMGDGDDANAIGIVTDIKVRKTKKGDKMASLVLEYNFQSINVTIWPSDYKQNKNMIDNSLGKIMVVTGQVKFDSYKGCNTVYSSKDGIIDVLE